MCRDKPYYNSSPIASVAMLAKVLGVTEGVLKDFSENKPNHYHSFEIETVKSDGSVKVRSIHEPKLLLKKIQKRINSRIFSKLVFPSYLHGGIRDVDNPRDYYTNASEHVRPSRLVSVDIKNFYDNIKFPFVIDIFQHLFNFPLDVATLLAELVTYNHSVPQGAATSSYIANLIFFDCEYRLVSSLRAKGIRYTRLLDDIVISSSSDLAEDKSIAIIKKIAAMVSSKGLSLNNKKTSNVTRSGPYDLLGVTGLLVGHNQPKCSRAERLNIRAEVHHCESAFQSAPDYRSRTEYHSQWNKASGRVAKLQRVGHPQADALRERLSSIYPTVSESRAQEMLRELVLLEKMPAKKRVVLGYHMRISKLIYMSGILSRTNKKLAKNVRERAEKLKMVGSYNAFWEMN